MLTTSINDENEDRVLVSGEERMRILVTGATGLVGKAVQQTVKTERTRGEWTFVNSKDCNLLMIYQVEELFAKIQPTHVLHLAAKVGGLFANMKFKADFLHENNLMNDNVLSTAAKYQCKVVSCLSTCIFPADVEYPLTEDKIHEGPPHKSNFGYAYAKRMIDVYNKMYNEQFGLTFTSVVPTNIFGPHDNYDLYDAHVIPALIHKCYLAKKNNTDFIVSGSGRPLRQFIYSFDLAKLMIWAVLEYEDVEPIIMSPNEDDEISIKQVAVSIAKAMKYDKPIIWDTNQSDGQFRKPSRNAKLMSYLPEFQFTDFEDALQNSVKWFIKNYEEARK